MTKEAKILLNKNPIWSLRVSARETLQDVGIRIWGKMRWVVNFRKFETYSGKHLKAYEIGATRRKSEIRPWETPEAKETGETQYKKRKESQERRRNVRNVKDNCRLPCYFRRSMSLSAALLEKISPSHVQRAFHVNCSFCFPLLETPRSSALCCLSCEGSTTPSVTGILGKQARTREHLFSIRELVSKRARACPAVWSGEHLMIINEISGIKRAECSRYHLVWNEQLNDEQFEIKEQGIYIRRSYVPFARQK